MCGDGDVWRIVEIGRGWVTRFGAHRCMGRAKRCEGRLHCDLHSARFLRGVLRQRRADGELQQRGQVPARGFGVGTGIAVVGVLWGVIPVVGLTLGSAEQTESSSSEVGYLRGAWWVVRSPVVGLRWWNSGEVIAVVGLSVGSCEQTESSSSEVRYLPSACTCTCGWVIL